MHKRYNTGAHRNFTHSSPLLKSFTSADGVALVALGQVLHPLGERPPLGGKCRAEQPAGSPVRPWDRGGGAAQEPRYSTGAHRKITHIGLGLGLGFHYRSLVRVGWRRWRWARCCTSWTSSCPLAAPCRWTTCWLSRCWSSSACARCRHAPAAHPATCPGFMKEML